MLRVRPDGSVDLDVHAVPRSSRDALGKAHDDRLKLHVKAAPVDGQANAAIIKLLSKTLGVPRCALELVRGQTGKRKTVRVTGLTRENIATKLGFGLGVGLSALLLVGAAACESASELPITVILPADTSDYEGADNASVVMRPSGDAFSFGVDGLDFSLELEGDPSTELQQLELYLADGEELLGWGSTVPFATAGPDVGLALFLGRPGLLSTWPEVLDTPDPALLAAEAVGRGMLMVQTDGDVFLLNHYSLQLETGSDLPSTSFTADDGGLFSAADGAVVRMAWEQVEPAAWRYDPSADTWTELSVGGAADIGARPGAATLIDPDRTRMYLLGGGGSTEGVAIDLQPDDDGVLAAAPIADLSLDGPRDGATALWIPAGDDPTADVLLVGGDEPGPLAVLASVGTSVGPSLAWRELACAVQAQDLSGASVLCLGGLVDGSETADAVSIQVVAGASAEVELRESFLPVALPDPLLLSDDIALYAQGQARWFRISRGDASVSEPNSAPLRAAGGHLVSLANGVTFLVGGVDQLGAALDRWQVFTPAVEP